MVIETVMSKKRAAEILLVEDNPADAILAQKAFSVVSIPCHLTVVDNGDEAMEILRHDEARDMILLDLNLPGKSGVDILREVKTSRRLWRIPVIILTTSRAEKDISACYDLLANCYVIKPLDFVSFKEFIQTLSQFWFAYSIPPRE